VLALRPDLDIIDVRGNLDTRMRKAEDGELDAVLLAAAGITRMGWADRITHYIEPSAMCPAVGQGAIGVEVREGDEFMAGVCRQLDDPATKVCITAERVVMRMLEGGCQVPIGAYCRVEGDGLVMDAIVADVDGTRVVRETVTGPADDPEGLGAEAVRLLLARGAGDILARVREASGGSVSELLGT
jgi:hydroxymethylbilane synthase